ncbi:tetratricopeptide repeat protein [Bacteroides sp. UBA939]|uniref:tetratricopeptide repeat protein n=1 Tax=Bacteroides sp. UBA939 TaxID=1946092 RepID=UPI0025BB7BF0|nr:tetratricopeptide repeat protein [Bacteroides sp. UBA939]
MKKIHILFFLFCLISVSALAQTLEQAKAFYNKGQYEKAKPVFKKFVKAQPANGNYNLWYGVCCLKTSEPAVALKYLETAVKKRIPGGQLYLAQTYNDLYYFDDAIKHYEEYISELIKRKRPTGDAEKLLEKSRVNLRMLKGVEEVCIIDSFVVDKDRFLEAYKISPESGELFSYNDFFQNKEEEEATVYETELGNIIYYGERQPDGKLSILSRDKMQGEWGKGGLLPGNINEAVNANYPYVLTDGLTIYYAADGEKSIGGYDIFVTRYNINTDTYLMPENVGMPFNSPHNDYMFVIDEFNNLGWFASDRYQPDKKVCIYVFIPNSSKRVYNYEAMDTKKAIQLARIHSLKDTWTDQNAVSDAKRRLQAALSEKPQAEQTHDFEFVIDDNTTYYQWSDFKSPQARNLFSKYRQLEKDFRQQQNKLENQRSQYTRSNDDQKVKLTPAILELEKRVQELSDEIERTAIEVRKAEKGNHK